MFNFTWIVYTECVTWVKLLICISFIRVQHYFSQFIKAWNINERFSLWSQIWFYAHTVCLRCMMLSAGLSMIQHYSSYKIIFKDCKKLDCKSWRRFFNNVKMNTRRWQPRDSTDYGNSIDNQVWNIFFDVDFPIWHDSNYSGKCMHSSISVLLGAMQGILTLFISLSYFSLTYIAAHIQ